ncbi:VOC family protein [Novosphingobium taihuense]|uniref:Catechol 2,3-dioxygenase-like lactoylglutathione lyase family enzyme n=1 Tax=Novosphingobium taihuense TaxID=260085 RepID=A0A7W7AFV6_9SPHN|nr:VOC family protein [Novosphingobium taihuense]MBB4615480.1 catechol 2,3-dioxygenase-like lactoylglutathione lyase family enzyme [Novosphingobium taihuense]TWH82074.1 glyoxalase/bleomycin resistance protein/dioxygenase superfamily protein [Novosphingobium taihuense]
MTRLVGPLRQVGIIVDDIDAAMLHWTHVVGVGPFVVFRNLEFDEDYHYRGTRAKPPVTSIAVGHSAGLQVEIIQQHNDAPSAYRDFLAAGRTGLQHVSTWCDDPAQYDSARQRLLDQGLTLVHEGRAAGGPCRFAYFSGAGEAWPQIEISEALIPSVKPLSDFLIAQAAIWDGTNPILDINAVIPLIYGEPDA